MARYALVDTAHGMAAIVWNGDTITGFRLPAATASETERAVRRRWPAATVAQPPASIAGIVSGVRGYFAGDPVDFAAVKLDLAGQNALFDRIYDRVRRIPRGEATTYGAVARDLELGPEFARDVGQAMARNPIPLFVPCHRVLGAGGQIGGFSAPGGAMAKQRMLALEGVVLAPAAPATDAQVSFGF